ncbi:MAG: phosphotransferase [Chlorobiaceae bacterium]|nr:phosphotransferase [Chlorobiaceae bacterium]
METRQLIGQLYPPDERDAIEIVRIKGDASNRQYFRVFRQDGTRIACIDPAFRGTDPDAYPFLTVGRLFADHGVRVPEVLAIDSAEGLLLLEDCGDRMLQDEMGLLDADALATRYRQVVDILVRIQSIAPDGSAPFSLSFDHEKLMFEFDFFIRHALHGLFAGVLDDGEILQLRREFETIADLLVLPGDFVLNHRDFHSRNIMLSGNEPVVIDFQDARLGLPQYDAVSLLRDSYVSLDAKMVDALKEYHYGELEKRGTITMGFEEYLRYFDLMAFQRNVKALGTFCYQVSVLGNTTFEQSIAPTAAFLPGYCEMRPELAAAGRLLQPFIRLVAP